MTPYTLDDIARYAEGEMSAEESQAFEQALAADDSLRQQLAFYHDVHHSLQQHFTKDAGQVQLEGTLQQMRGEFFKKESKTAKVVSINRYLRYAMGVAAVLLITLFLWKPWQPSLFEQYSQAEMIDPTSRGDNADSLLKQAAVLFNTKRFQEAATVLQEASALRPDDSFTKFYHALSLIHIDSSMKAMPILTKLYEGESVYKYEAPFYIALGFVKQNRSLDQARVWLQRIHADAANYNKAQELLRKL